jgi:hypothetical protein
VTSPAPPAPGTTDGPASSAATYELTLAEQVRRCAASDAGSHSFAWKLVKDVRRDDVFVYLHLSKSFAFVVPFRAVSTQQLDAFWWVVGRWAPHLVRDSGRA